MIQPSGIKHGSPNVSDIKNKVGCRALVTTWKQVAPRSCGVEAVSINLVLRIILAKYSVPEPIMSASEMRMIILCNLYI
jgi:hypothetical protein